jgi:hypothetical protein
MFVVWALLIGLLFEFLGQKSCTMAADAETAGKLVLIFRTLSLKSQTA